MSDAKILPCWRDQFSARKHDAEKVGEQLGNDIEIERPEVFMSLVVPAYNEEERIEIMLEEAVEYLREQYGPRAPSRKPDGAPKSRNQKANGHHISPAAGQDDEPTGWEILVVSDGSTDKTIETVLDFARRSGKDASFIRVVSLRKNRGKGGAVTHGMRHVRGRYAVFADADGASKFGDLGKLVRASKEIEDAGGRGVAVGSRAHLVGSEAVVKVRYFLSYVLQYSYSQRVAFVPPQSVNAFIPFITSTPYASGDSRHSRYAMWFQAFLAPFVALHNTLHALRRLDLRC